MSVTDWICTLTKFDEEYIQQAVKEYFQSVILIHIYERQITQVIDGDGATRAVSIRLSAPCSTSHIYVSGMNM